MSLAAEQTYQCGIKWQSLLQIPHLCVVSGRWSCCLPFCVLACPLLQSSELASPVFRYCYRALLHFVRSAAIKALPGHIVDVDGLHISHADIFISHVMAAGAWSPPPCQLTVEDGFWNARVCPGWWTAQDTADMLLRWNVDPSLVPGI